MFSHIESIPDILALQPCVSGIYPTEPAVMTRQPIATRLFQPLVFVHQQDLDHQLMPYPLNFTNTPRHAPAISDFPAPLYQ
jgi:hypothetical protein